MRSQVRAIGLALVASLASGCSLPGVAGVLAVGGAVSVAGNTSEVVYPATVLELDHAVEHAFTELEIERVSRSQDTYEGEYGGRLADGREVVVDYLVVGEGQVEVAIRAGWLGDEDISASFHDELRLELERLWLDGAVASGPGLN